MKIQYKQKDISQLYAKRSSKRNDSKGNFESKLLKKVDADRQKPKEQKIDIKKSFIRIDKQSESICQIMKYMLGQYQNDVKTEYCNEAKTCENWEVQELMKHVKDTNLGDFIIKCPNPDKISEELEDKYGGKEQSKTYQLNLSQALEYYYDLFEIQTSSKLQQEKQNIAFLLSFYFLKFKNTLEDKDELIITYLKIYNYFQMINAVELSEYIKMRQGQQFYEKYEKLIHQSFKRQYEKLKCFTGYYSKLEEYNMSWFNLKKAIYENLNAFLVKEFKKYVQDQDGLKDESIFPNLIGKVKSISQFLKTFPKLIAYILTYIRAESGKSDQNFQKRYLFCGQYLRKTLSGENVIWINTKNRPYDVTTLLRFCLIYKLVIKSKLYVRSFLSKNQECIILVIKTSQQILENYAQKYKINMEIDLGATDIFSFQPVDHYLRPLRLHKYVRDLQFREKYNVKGPEKKDKKDEDGIKSIESEALTIYRKAQVMNEDELRTKIIQDQFQADSAYNWVSKKLNIDFIKQKILTNEYNTQNPSRNTWQIYFVYNKMIIQFINRVKTYYKIDKKAKEYYHQLDGNLGMILRLMFLKALNTCNQMFYDHRQTRSIIPRTISNIWTTKVKLKNIWHYMEVDNPSGFCTYRRIKSNEKMWRKFQINELKDRSKFFPSLRLIITNKVVYDCVNISKALQNMHIVSYYPLHDPYVLKNIEILPFITNIKNLRKQPRRQEDGPSSQVVNKLYSQYQCQLTKQDFTKLCIQQKLAFSMGSVQDFSTQSVRFYCGQKIAFFFQFMKYLPGKAFPFLLLAMIIQILLWKQQTDILTIGSSTITSFNNVLIFVFTFINVFWTTNLVQRWKSQQKKLAQKFGVSQMTQFQEKRVKFEGSFQRNFQTDELNFEYVPKWKTFLKTIFTILLNLSYVLLVALVILLLFLFKTYLYQSGVDQNIVNQLPTILISIASQVFNKIYTIIIRNITIFQNHKTVAQYEGSLISKASLITFVINFYSIFIFAYFSNYLSSSYICEIKTTTTLTKIQNCDYFVSSQLLSLVMVDMAVTIVGAILPFVMFKVQQFLASRNKTKPTKHNFNFFESIDNFYEQQDSMDAYMFNEELDNSWMGYMKIISVFTATALFAPALPFSYVMMYVTGVVRLHASKYEIIYLKKRILPIKSNSIGWWLTIIEVISFLSIITNIAYMIYTRELFTTNKAQLFFLFIVLFFALKYYLLSQYSVQQNKMSQRNDIKTSDLLLGRRNDKYDNIPEQVNTDIENVIYDETVLKRKFHNLKGANIKLNKID